MVSGGVCFLAGAARTGLLLVFVRWFVRVANMPFTPLLNSYYWLLTLWETSLGQSLQCYPGRTGAVPAVRRGKA